MLYTINPFINNLYIIKDYNIDIKLYIDDNKILIDNRIFLQGIRRFLDNSGLYNYNNIENIIKNTYNQISTIILINNFIMEKNSGNKENEITKYKLYVLLLESLEGLKKLSIKYNFLYFYNDIKNNLIPLLKS